MTYTLYADSTETLAQCDTCKAKAYKKNNYFAKLWANKHIETAHMGISHPQWNEALGNSR